MHRSYRHALRAMALLAIFWCAAASAGTFAVAPSALDVGVVRPNSSTAQTLTVTNSSSVPCKLLSVDVSCTMCTHMTFTPATLAPGKSATIQVTFSPPATEDGPVHRSVTLHTSDPQQPNIKIPLTGYVTDTAGIWPPEMTFAAPQPPGSDVSSTFEIINVSDAPVTPLYATGPVSGPKLQVPHTPIAAGRGQHFTRHGICPCSRECSTARSSSLSIIQSSPNLSFHMRSTFRQQKWKLLRYSPSEEQPCPPPPHPWIPRQRHPQFLQQPQRAHLPIPQRAPRRRQPSPRWSISISPKACP